jgi:hypothetical protein
VHLEAARHARGSEALRDAVWADAREAVAAQLQRSCHGRRSVVQLVLPQQLQIHFCTHMRATPDLREL